VAALRSRSGLIGVVVGVLILAAIPVAADVGDSVLQGRANSVDKRTTLRGESSGATLRLVNKKPGAAGMAIAVAEGSPPLKVNSRVRVDDLNADYLDGKTSRYFATVQAQPGQTHVGAFGAAGDGTFLVHAATFSTPLPQGVPQSNIHYVLPAAGPTSQCPGVFEAKPGHLCIYATWEHNVAFNGVGRINNEYLNSGVSRYGFTISWTGTSSSANVRGSWAYTVPAADQALAPAEASVPETMTPTGIIPWREQNKTVESR